MIIEVELPDDTVEWLDQVQGLGGAEAHIARIIYTSLTPLMDAQPNAKLKPLVDARNAACRPKVKAIRGGRSDR
jgi:hypothetical protein